jgi:hypothetical protein
MAVLCGLAEKWDNTISTCIISETKITYADVKWRLQAKSNIRVPQTKK